MRVVIYSPWENAWIPLYKAAFEARGHSFERGRAKDIEGADIYLHGWADALHPIVPGAVNIVFLRRYELYERDWPKLDWKNVNHLVCCNAHVAQMVSEHFAEMNIKTPISVIYNAVDPKGWTFKVRKPNTNVGMACHIHPKKNIPLAMQILAELPDQYALHIAGAVQDQWALQYVNNFAECMRRKVVIYGQIPYDQMNLWWEQMGVCLSASYTEGNPNNVIQAMAKGIKPIVHIWPGAIQQFPEDVLFATAREAAQKIQSPEYNSVAYRDFALQHFGLANIEKVVDMAESFAKVPA